MGIAGAAAGFFYLLLTSPLFALLVGLLAGGGIGAAIAWFHRSVRAEEEVKRVREEVSYVPWKETEGVQLAEVRPAASGNKPAVQLPAKTNPDVPSLRARHEKILVLCEAALKGAPGFTLEVQEALAEALRIHTKDQNRAAALRHEIACRLERSRRLQGKVEDEPPDTTQDRYAWINGPPALPEKNETAEERLQRVIDKIKEREQILIEVMRKGRSEEELSDHERELEAQVKNQSAEQIREILLEVEQ